MLNKGDKVKIEYEGKLESGKVFDSSKKHDKPLEFEIGSGKVIKGFEDAVKDMKEGEEKEITLKPEEAYGPYRKELIKEAPKDKLPKDRPVKEGAVVVIGLPNGSKIPARITEVGEEKIKLDLNHPLAGKKLKFKIKLLEVN